MYSTLEEVITPREKKQRQVTQTMAYLNTYESHANKLVMPFRHAHGVERATDALLALQAEVDSLLRRDPAHDFATHSDVYCANWVFSYTHQSEFGLYFNALAKVK